jgi:putative transposase
MSRSKPLYYRRRFPAEIISHCVWLYFRFCLSYRDVEEIMAERGVAVTYETIRDWFAEVWRDLRQAATISGCASWRSLASR